jgi:hypothetical protein
MANIDACDLQLAAVFHGVGQQVDEHLAQERRVRLAHPGSSAMVSLTRESNWAEMSVNA